MSGEGEATFKGKKHPDSDALERAIMRGADQMPHPCFGAVVLDTGEVFIFDELAADLTSPAHCVRYMLPRDYVSGPGPLILRAPEEGDPDSREWEEER